MSFARNFALGQQIAQTALDTYDRAKQQRRFRDISEAKPVEIENSYTSQDAEQLRALANAKDAQGNAYYNLEANPDGSYGLKANFTYQGQDGQMVQPGGVATSFAPRASAVEFMGTRYAPEDLNPDRIDGLRARAMADVIAESDPVRGLQMRQSIKAGERDDKRFGWEEQQQPLKYRQLEQTVRTGDIQLGQSERALEVQNLVDEVAKMPQEALKAYAAKLNTNESNLPFLMVGESKDGYKFLTIDPKTGRPMGKEFTVNDAQLRELAAASVLGMAGYGAESLQRLTSVNKDIADIVTKMNATTAQVVTSQNDATSKGRADYFKQQQADQTGAYYNYLRNKDAQKGQAQGLENEINGVLEGYQAAMAAGPQGKQAAAIYAREYDQLRAIAGQRGLKVPPSLAAMTAAQRGGDAKPVKVEDAGQRYLVDGQLRVTDGRGGFISEDGFLPDDRTGVLAKAGVPDYLISQLRWNQNGTEVGFRGRAYDMRDPKDIRALISDAKRLGANDIAVDEYQRQPHGGLSTGFGPRITYTPDPRAPSIYAGPEEWADYRLLQQNR